MLLSTLPSDSDGIAIEPTASQDSETAFQNQCCLALMIPVIFFGLSMGLVWGASQLDWLEFHMLYALALQVVMLFVFTLIYLASGIKQG